MTITIIGIIIVFSINTTVVITINICIVIIKVLLFLHARGFDPNYHRCLYEYQQRPEDPS